MGKLFGTSGIRGLVDKKLTPEFCSKLGLTAAAFYGDGSTVLVGYDHRPQAQVVSHALISGLLAGGVDVIDVGMSPTPAALYAVRELDADGAIVVTGSHTIPEIIGILFFNKDTSEFVSSDEKKFEEIFFNEKYNRVPWNRLGRLEYYDISDIYLESVLSLIDTSKVEGRRVVIDSGNSSASNILRGILLAAGVDTIALNDYPDPTFPGRGPFPKADTLQEMGRVTFAWKADIGVGVDGDGDRAIFCDEKGTVYWGDVTSAIFAMDAIRKGAKKIVVTINTSHVVAHIIQRTGGEVIFSRIGPPAIVETMKRNNAKLGLEESGKYIWSDAIYYGDAALATLRMLEILETTGKSLSELVSELPRFHMKKIAIRCPDELKKLVLERAYRRAKKRLEGEISEVITIDGVKIILRDGSWLLLRPSGTEPVFRVFAESMDEKKTDFLIEIGEGMVKEIIEFLKRDVS